MKVLTVYKSKSGASMYYAEEIAKALGGQAVNYRRLPTEKAELVIYCAGVNRGKVDGYRMLSGKLAALGGQVWVAASCLSVPQEDLRLDVAEKSDIPADALYLLRGRMSRSRLGWFDRLTVNAHGRQLEKKIQKTQEDRDILHALTFPTSFTEIRYILPIVKAARALLDDRQ